MTETAMEAALKKAGMKTGSAQLYALAARALTKHNGDIGRATATFIKELDRATDARLALHQEYLERVAADMKSGKTPDAAGAGHLANDARAGAASPAAPKQKKVR